MTKMERALTKLLRDLDPRLVALEVESGVWQPSIPLETAQHSAHLAHYYRLLFAQYKFEPGDPNWNEKMTDDGKAPSDQFRTDIESAIRMHDLVTNVLTRE